MSNMETFETICINTWQKYMIYLAKYKLIAIFYKFFTLTI